MEEKKNNNANEIAKHKNAQCSQNTNDHFFLMSPHYEQGAFYFRGEAKTILVCCETPQTLKTNFFPNPNLTP